MPWWELVPSFHVPAEYGAVHDVAGGRSATRKDDDVLPIRDELAIGAAKQPARPPHQCFGMVGVSGGDDFDGGCAFRVGRPRGCDLDCANPSARGIAQHESITDPCSE